MKSHIKQLMMSTASNRDHVAVCIDLIQRETAIRSMVKKTINEMERKMDEIARFISSLEGNAAVHNSQIENWKKLLKTCNCNDH